MAKEAYIGIDNVSKHIGQMYVGVDGVARKVVKAYVGVDGIARLFFESYVDRFIDFEYVDNGNGTFTLTAWRGTLDGVESTELVIPDDPTIIL